MRRWRAVCASGASRLRTSPLSWALLGALALFCVGLGWGLPASDTWDNDGVAPRDFLVAVASTFDKGPFDFAYLHLAPVHLVLLALLTLPITLTAVGTAHSTAPAVLVHEIIRTPYMTAIAWVARLVTVAMAVGQVWALAKMGQELRGRRAGALVGAVTAVNAVLVYYAHTSALEVPYLFWASLALLALVRALARREPKRLRVFAVLGALAIGSKDQAAGVFLLSAPAAIAAWIVTDDWAKLRRAEVIRAAFVALGVAVLVFLVTDEIVLNPSGFAARVRFLLGPASQDHAQYSRDVAGRTAALIDSVRHVGWFFPVAFVPFAAVGLWGLARGQPERRVAGMVPVLAAFSFVVTVTLTALRTEHRFLLFPMEMLGFYAGLGFDAVLDAAGDGRARWAARGAVGALLGSGAFAAAGVDAVLLFDPRYEAEDWMRVHVAAGDTIETYGLNVYLPRFPTGSRVERVGPEPPDRRSPLDGVMEVESAWSALSARHPKWIVVSQGWVWHYLESPSEATHGRILPRAQAAEARDVAASHYFRALMNEELGYRKVRLCRFRSSVWPNVQIHASTGQDVWILEREG